MVQGVWLRSATDHILNTVCYGMGNKMLIINSGDFMTSGKTVAFVLYLWSIINQQFFFCSNCWVQVKYRVSKMT